MIQPLWRTVWRFLKKLKIELPYDQAIPLLRIYPEKTTIQKESCTTMFIADLFTIARTWNQPKCPWTYEWIKKVWHIYTMESLKIDVENGLEDTGRGKGKLGRSERIAWTYIHYQM